MKSLRSPRPVGRRVNHQPPASDSIFFHADIIPQKSDLPFGIIPTDMIGISKLYFGTVEESDKLRYRKGVHRRPVVVWNCTQTCT